MDLNSVFEETLNTPVEDQLRSLVLIGRQYLEASQESLDKNKYVKSLVQVVQSSVGTPADRMAIGEILGIMGDPRLCFPDEEDYWISVTVGASSIQVGRYPVTNREYLRFVEQGGYESTAHWSEAGLAWLKSCENPWPELAKRTEAQDFIVGNQPVVGVNFYEAEAYGKFYGCRLLRAEERVEIMRGKGKKPYPWGAPFGAGNANTQEEVLGRPCAVGLYLNDTTPDGVADLAGNVAEWTGDQSASGVLIHPGAWDQPSMAAWAKALCVEKPEVRWAALGFRISRG